MSRKIRRTLLYSTTIVLLLGVVSLVTTSAYRGINSSVCRHLAEQFSLGPGLLEYEDLDRLGDCVAFYKRIYSVLKRGPLPEEPKSMEIKHGSPPRVR